MKYSVILATISSLLSLVGDYSNLPSLFIVALIGWVIAGIILVHKMVYPENGYKSYDE
jgi:hypothetical protein